jgi:hypothetical protein
MSSQGPVIQSQQHNQDVTNILFSVKYVGFGSVKVVIPASKVIRIERKENIRLDTHQSNHPSDLLLTIQHCCRI